MDLLIPSCMLLQEEVVFVLERKNQRTFMDKIFCLPDAERPEKVFLLLFLQKKKILAFLSGTGLMPSA